MPWTQTSEDGARDNLADVLTSAAALLGVWASRLVHPLFDPVAGVPVSLWIFRTAWGILHENLGYLTGRSAPPELANRIVAAAPSEWRLGCARRSGVHVDADVRRSGHF
jgi:divalent metal cation (Fe/Co/Zn/Cd) transporter